MKSIINGLKNLRADNKDQKKEDPKKGPDPVSSSLKLDPVLEQLLSSVRSRHVRQEFLSVNQQEYTQAIPVKLVVASFNVNGKKPPTNLKLGDWLGCNNKHNNGDSFALSNEVNGPGIVVVGFQEIVPLSAGNVIAGSTMDNPEAWDFRIAATLNGEEWAKAYMPCVATAPQPSSKSVNNLAVPASDPNAGFLGLGETTELPAPSSVSAPALVGTPTVVRAAADQLDAARNPSMGNLYSQVASHKMVGLYASVWVRNSLLPYTRGVQLTSLATGFAGFLGNKGAIAVRLQVYDSPLLFVVSHLSSGSGEGDEARRNQDVEQILRRTVFTRDTVAPCTTLASGIISTSLGPGVWGMMRGIYDHINVIWCGDLNYRINMADEDVRRALQDEHLEMLLQADQLNMERAAQRVFQGFAEGKLSFLPTFKYKVGGTTYLGDATISSGSNALKPEAGVRLGDPEDEGDDDGPGSSTAEKQRKRTPAWTDRILWLKDPGSGLEQVGYGRAEVLCSDHRPVWASFNLKCRMYDRPKIDTLIDAALRVVDKRHDQLRPRCSLEPQVIDIGEIPYGTPHTFHVTLSNAGGVEGYYHFIPIPKKGAKWVVDGSEPICPAWVTLEPQEGTVDPGSQASITVTITVEGGANGAAASLYPAPNNHLDTVLILRVEDGSDMFLSITGSFARSSFGMPLTKLLEYGDRPVATSTPPGQEASGQEDLLPMGSLVPKEILRLLKALAQPSTLSTPGLFVRSEEEILQRSSNTTTSSETPAPSTATTIGYNTPSPAEECIDGVYEGSKPSRRPLFWAQVRKVVSGVSRVREALDRGEEIPKDASAHEIAATLLALFRSLPSPILPAAADEVCMMGVPSPEEVETLLAQSMGHCEWAVVQAVVALLRRAAQLGTGDEYEEHAASICSLLAECWFPPLPWGAGLERQNNRAAFIRQLLSLA